MKEPVLTKVDFVRRYARGEFGNASPTWNNPGEVPWDKLDTNGARFHIRNRVAGGPTYYNIDGMTLIGEWTSLIDEGVDPRTLYVSEMAPSEKTILQGEVLRGNRNGLEMTYTTVAKPMREALAVSTRFSSGVMALAILQGLLCPNSWEWLNVLLDEYPDHVVEFSTYSVEWGTLSGYNTVFWEVRKY